MTTRHAPTLPVNGSVGCKTILIKMFNSNFKFKISWLK